MTLRNLAFASLFVLSACAGPNFAFAQNAPSCDKDNTLTTLDEQVAAKGLKAQKLTEGTLQAFNAELAKEHSSDVKDFPAMDVVEAITLQAADDDEIVVGMAFKDGCYIGSTQMTLEQFNAILSRIQS